MKRIGQLSELRSLALDGALVTDEGLMELASLEHLELLSLRDTLVTSRGLDRLRSLPNLRSTRLFTPLIERITLEKRRKRRAGFTGRLRLAWGFLIEDYEHAGIPPVAAQP
jgi:hypothetical protein